MIETPRITTMERRQTAMIHLRIPRDDMMAAFGPAIEELLAVLAEQDIEPAGPVFAHHLRMDPATFDFELGVPVESPVLPDGRVQPGQQPASRVARTVHHGPYEELPDAWRDFDAWMKAEGVRQAPDLWEVYLVGPETTKDPAQWRTELNRPVED